MSIFLLKGKLKCLDHKFGKDFSFENGIIYLYNISILFANIVFLNFSTKIILSMIISN